MNRGRALGLAMAMLAGGCSATELVEKPAARDRPGQGAGGAGAVVHPADTPPWSIVYNVLQDADADNYEIFIMQMDGSGKQRLTDHPAVDWAYVSHGSTLYLVSDREAEKRKFHLYKMRSDGTELRRITDFLVRDSWLGVRKGGDELIVSSSRGGTADLFLIDSRGREIARLTHDEERDNDPAFSPDGSQVVWRHGRFGEEELWIMKADGSRKRRLTHYPMDEAPDSKHFYRAGPPSWEPNRGIISYCSRRKDGSGIFSIRPDGSGEERISDGCYHSWSPDGRYLAHDAENDQGNHDIYLRDMETGEVERLTDDPGYEQGPVFVLRP